MFKESNVQVSAESLLETLLFLKFINISDVYKSSFSCDRIIIIPSIIILPSSILIKHYHLYLNINIWPYISRFEIHRDLGVLEFTFSKHQYVCE